MKINTAVRRPPVFTHEGARASHITPEMELKRTIASCLLWEDTFYESGEDIYTRLSKLAGTVEPSRVSDIALAARTRFKLRHAPLVLARELARKGGSIAGKTLEAIIQRPDEITEFLALYWKDKRQPLSAQVKKALARAFTKFDSYQLSKWNKDSAIKLRDALFLVHAKPQNEKQAAAFKALIDFDKTASANTWENRLSAVGQNKEATEEVKEANKKEVWEDMLRTKKLGAMAFLKNLRGMAEVHVDPALIKEYAKTVNVERILPFRFIAAAKAAPYFVPVIEDLMLRCLAGQPKLNGRTVLLMDVSGSMFGPKVSAKSDLDRFHAGAALGILLRGIADDVRVFTFSNNIVEIPLYQGFALADAMERSQPHSGTYTGRAIRVLNSAFDYDRLIVVTDEQSAEPLPEAKGKGYIINVAPYKNGIAYDKYTHISGWSEAIIDYIREVENIDSVN